MTCLQGSISPHLDAWTPGHHLDLGASSRAQSATMQLADLALAMPRSDSLDYWPRIQRWLPSLVCWQRQVSSVLSAWPAIGSGVSWTLSHTQPDPLSVRGSDRPWGFIIHSQFEPPPRPPSPFCSGTLASSPRAKKHLPGGAGDQPRCYCFRPSARRPPASYEQQLLSRELSWQSTCMHITLAVSRPPYYVHATHSLQPALRSAVLFPAAAAVCSAKPARAFVRAIETPPSPRRHSTHPRQDPRVRCLGRRCGRTPNRAEDNGMSQTCEVR